MIWKQTTEAQVACNPDVYVGDTVEKHDVPRDSRYTGLKLNPRLPGYELGVLSTLPQYSTVLWYIGP
jgi:hypothetical protein